MKMNKKVMAFLMAICLSISAFGITASAATDETIPNTNGITIPANETIIYQDEDVTVTRIEGNPSQNNPVTYNEMTYESVWLNSSASGSFDIYTPNSGTIGITVKVESSSDSSWAWIGIQKPNGTYFVNNKYVDRNTNNGEGGLYRIYSASSGTYKIHYMASTTVGMRIMCWFY